MAYIRNKTVVQNLKKYFSSESEEFFEKLGESVFENCESLTEINLPPSLKILPKMTFKNCKNLQTITLPKGLKGVGESAFEGCTNLTNVEGIENVTNIHEDAFKSASQDPPNKVTEEGDNLKF